MQACIYEEYGSPEVVRVAEVATPRPKPDEVLVRVHATSVTTADWRLRASVFPRVFWLPGRLVFGLFRPRKPILGMDFSGVVEAVGERVRRFRAGERVFGAAGAMERGAHAQYVTVRETGAILPKPDCLTDTQAAAIPFGANTALQFLRDFGKLQAGQRVLILGASGGVGVWAVQLARHIGAEVTGVCSARNTELVRSLGAHHVIDYASGQFAQPGVKYDLIFDAAGLTTFAKCKAVLTDRGVYLPLEGGHTELIEALLTAWSKGKKLKHATSQNRREDLEHIVELIQSGVVEPVIDRVYPMEQIVEAHRHVESRHKRGSVVVTVADALQS